MQRRVFLSTAISALGAAVAACSLEADQKAAAKAGGETFEVTKTEAEWRKILTPTQFQILRRHDTETPGTSPLNSEHRKGIFSCAGCALPLYSSETKFESGTGWPSFWDPLPDAIGTSEDRSYFTLRTEVHCRRCGGHLGHVFDDGPKPTFKRYCMNGGAMVFQPA
jgi:peptide-methionine (R)-S-oxide reductase